MADSGCLVGYVVSCRHLIIMVKYWFIYSYLREASASLSIFTPKGNSRASNCEMGRTYEAIDLNCRLRWMMACQNNAPSSILTQISH